MWNCLNELDDDEDDIEISHVTHKFLMANAIKSANKIINEWKMDGKVLLTDEQREKKVDWLIDICYTESLKMLKKKIVRRMIFFIINLKYIVFKIFFLFYFFFFK